MSQKTIIITIITILVCGEGVLFYQIASLRHALAGKTALAAVVAPNASDTGPASPSTSLPSNSLRPIYGEIIEIGTNMFLVAAPAVQSQPAPEPQKVIADAATTIVSEGALKDQKTQDMEMEAFRKSSYELAADPQKNRDALATLIAPSRYQETVLRFSDLKKGDTVQVFGIDQPDGSLKAVRMTRFAPR